MRNKIIRAVRFGRGRAEIFVLEPEPNPVINENIPVWELVIKDMQARDLFGRHKYGIPLQPFNGRDALKDAYQEALDLCVYLRQALYERDERKDGN